MFNQSVKMAAKAITTNKLRSFLTMLGIIIGVVSLIVLVSLVSNTTDSVNEEISGIGSNYVTVSIQDDKEQPLKLADLTTFAKEKEIAAVAPISQTSITASGNNTSETAAVYGTTAAYEDIQGLSLSSGRFLKTADVDNHSQVAVINSQMAIDVLGRPDVIGETIQLNGTNYQVVGILQEADSAASMTESEEDEAYIPYTSLIRLGDNVSKNITTFCAAAASEDTLDKAEAAIETKLMERFKQDEDAFTIRNQSAVMEAMENVNNTLALLLGGIAGISLLVGGIGIMNIMLVSVTERTREIGIRKAVGASRGSIMQQFLIEAMLITLIGCGIGILLSILILQMISVAGGEDIQYHLSLGITWIAVGFSMLIGIGFGIYPANKAAKKNPIDALRYAG